MAQDFASRFGKYAHKALGIEATTLDRARKVNALVERGATEGEKAAALSRLASIATAAGTSVETLQRAL